MVLPAVLGAVGSLANVFAQAGAQQDTNNLNWANLFETKRQNRKHEKLATATRKDANGNIVQYNEATNEWEIIPSPTSKQILEAEQQETLKSLTEDAPRNREARVRQDERSKLGDEEFTKKFNEFRFRPQSTEGEHVADATTSLLHARKQGMSEASAMLARQLARTGGGSGMEQIFKTANDQYAGSLEETMLKGKALGKASFAELEGAKDGRMMQELGFLGSIADNSPTAPVASSGINQQLSGTAEGALSQLLSVLQSGEGRRQGATAQLAQSLSKAPDFGQLFSALGQLGSQLVPQGGGSAAPTVIPYPRPREEGISARQRASNGF